MRFINASTSGRKRQSERALAVFDVQNDRADFVWVCGGFLLELFHQALAGSWNAVHVGQPA